jgi:chloride channel 7
MGVCSFGVDAGLETLNTWKFDTLRRAAAASLAASGGARGGPASGLGFYAALVAICLSLASASAALVAFGSPWAAGSGIPEVKAYLNGVHIPGLLTLKTLICKLVGLTCSMAGGLIAGKEGPFVHAGAIVGGGWAAMGSQSVAQALVRLGGWGADDAARAAAAPREWGGYFRSDAEHRDFVFIGAAAGEGMRRGK